MQYQGTIFQLHSSKKQSWTVWRNSYFFCNLLYQVCNLSPLQKCIYRDQTSCLSSVFIKGDVRWSEIMLNKYIFKVYKYRRLKTTDGSCEYFLGHIKIVFWEMQLKNRILAFIKTWTRKVLYSVFDKTRPVGS